MSGQRVDGLGREIRWPTHAGVAGVSIHALSASPEHQLGNVAREAVAAWTTSCRTRSQAAGTAHRFPYREVLDHYQAVGRAAASASLVADLTGLYRSRESEHGHREVDDLGRWLRSTIDQVDGDYHSYLGTALLEAFLADANQGSADENADMLLCTFLLDLLRIEAEALAAAPSAAQRRRTRAVLIVLARAELLAPGAIAVLPDLRPALSTLNSPGGNDGVADIALKLSACADLLTGARQLIDITMLPMTPLHDEQMFIRMIQIFECLYSRTSWSLRAATAALDTPDATRVSELIDGTADRLAAASALYRILTTMPPEIFAIIRDYTMGRSAVQSRAYRRVQDISARLPGRERSPEIPESTLEDTFLRVRPWLSDHSYESIRAAMRRLDRTWCALKRSHWGITLKTIGNVPGTGGTSGAEYLDKTSRIPLFPALAEPTA
jgi:hypothetical protein